MTPNQKIQIECADHGREHLNPREREFVDFLKGSDDDYKLSRQQAAFLTAVAQHAARRSVKIAGREYDRMKNGGW